MKVEQIKPYDTEADKREQITQAFDRLAGQYDRMNRILSLGIDTLWRRRAIRLLASDTPGTILDAATGTADMAVMAARLLPQAEITGVDLSESMLAAGRLKTAKAGVGSRIRLQVGDCLALAFADNTFDAVITAFGIRNFANLSAGLSEFARVLKPGGRLIVLELSEPRFFPARQLFRFYLRHFVPQAGALLAGKPAEYRYLQKSVEQVPQGAEMLDLLRAAGFTACRLERYTLGICTCYTAQKTSTRATGPAGCRAG